MNEDHKAFRDTPNGVIEVPLVDNPPSPYDDEIPPQGDPNVKAYQPIPQYAPGEEPLDPNAGPTMMYGYPVGWEGPEVPEEDRWWDFDE